MTRRDDPSPPDYYARLGVQLSASTEEIRAAYREKARVTHPDHNPDGPGATERFRKAKEAYQVLRDPERRARCGDIRAARQQMPHGLTINQRAPAGCRGYLWRVLAGMVAVGLFVVLEALDVWAASSVWTITAAVGASSLVAGAIAVFLAHQFPDEATDVMVRLTQERVLMRADGHTTLQTDWSDVKAVPSRRRRRARARCGPGGRAFPPSEAASAHDGGSWERAHGSPS